MLEIINAQLSPNGEVFNHRFFDGGINVILGSNDSGKTNLCRFLTGLSSTVSGEVLIDSESYSKISKRRPVSLVVQDFVNYPLWTVEENINSPLRAQGNFTKTQISARTSELGELLGLTDYLKRYPAELSGGQQQRVALGRALAKNAKNNGSRRTIRKPRLQAQRKLKNRAQEFSFEPRYDDHLQHDGPKRGLCYRR